MALQHLQHHRQQAHLHIQLPVFPVQLVHSHEQHALHIIRAHWGAATCVSAAVAHLWSLPNTLHFDLLLLLTPLVAVNVAAAAAAVAVAAAADTTCCHHLLLPLDIAAIAIAIATMSTVSGPRLCKMHVLRCLCDEGVHVHASQS